MNTHFTLILTIIISFLSCTPPEENNNSVEVIKKTTLNTEEISDTKEIQKKEDTLVRKSANIEIIDKVISLLFFLLRTHLINLLLYYLVGSYF